jgi:hypothetical protein
MILYRLHNRTFLSLVGADIASSVPNMRSFEMAEESTPTVHTERNKILGGLAELSFHDAIVAVDERLLSEKNKTKRLSLLSAKSWLLRNKLHSALHDPYIYAINEVENTDIFDDLEGDESSSVDSLFDDDDDEGIEDNVSIEILKNTTLNGHKLLKGIVASVTQENADKLVDQGKAKIVEA